MATRRQNILLILGSLPLLAWPVMASAYVGPTLGIGIIGSIIAIVVVLALSLFSFVVMPWRRWRNRRREAAPQVDDDSGSRPPGTRPADDG